MSITSQIWIRPFLVGEDPSSFRSLNEEWITRFFSLEDRDREALADPERNILARGGHIYLAWTLVRDEAQVIGCVALVPMENGVYELSKMAVSPTMRRRGIGRQLLEHVISEARRIGAQALFLGSNTKLEDAVRLYEAVGFTHVPMHRLPKLGYARANVFMELDFREPSSKMD